MIFTNSFYSEWWHVQCRAEGNAEKTKKKTEHKNKLSIECIASKLIKDCKLSKALAL